jgi:hypothetical protein
MSPECLAPHHHAVQFYGSDETLMQTLAGFLAGGLITGQPAVVIATPSHSTAVLDELAHRLIDVKSARRIGDLVFLDANEILATFMRDDMPDRDAFRHTVGGVIRQTLAGRTTTPLRAYGEMVDVLWKRGNEEAAIKLEMLWNDLSRTYPFQLLCGYSIGNFYKQTGSFERICEQHTHVMTESSALPFERRVPISPG